MKKRERSPTARKRGRVPATTTGSRMITSAPALPTRSFVQATAITRAVPLKAGMSKVTFAVPSASTFTTPEKRARGSWVGGMPSRGFTPMSPPERIAPRVPCIPSMRKP
jgi:hypothetical protein